MNELTAAVCQAENALQVNGHESNGHESNGHEPDGHEPNGGHVPGGHEPSDAELLRRFLAAHDQSAFEALVRRHGPMVHGVCRRVLPDTHAAEDAFQATFLVLVRKAGSLRQPELLANWLYGTAYRIARKVRLRKVERQTRESRVEAMPSHASLVDLEWQEVRTVLDEELNRLPEQLRAPLVLCYLCGQTNVEAARSLGWPAGSIAGRLAQARETLRHRLNRRGLSLSAGLLAFLLTEKGVEAAVPEALMVSTVMSAGGGGALPASVVGLVEEGLGEPSLGVFRYAKLASAAVVAALAVLMGWSAVRAAGRGRDFSAVSGRGGWSFSALLGGNSPAGAAVSASATGCATSGCGAAASSTAQSAGCASASGGCTGGAGDSPAAAP